MIAGFVLKCDCNFPDKYFVTGRFQVGFVQNKSEIALQCDLALSSSIFRGLGVAHFFRRSLLTGLYDSLRVRTIGQAIGQAIGNRAWSPKALTIYLSSMYSVSPRAFFSALGCVIVRYFLHNNFNCRA